MKTIVTTLFTVTLLFISYQSFTSVNGPIASVTNAPGEVHCGQCHGSGTPVVSGSVWSGMTLSVVGATLGTLKKDTTYTLSLTFSDPSSIKYGFQLCVLQAGANASTASLGTLISTTPETQLVTSSNRTYLEHTSGGTSASSNTLTWTFQWHTPVSYVGGATFYVAVNSTDNDASNSATDVIYTKTFAATISLPVSWLYTQTEMEGEDVLINWATASEKNNWKFDIEKSVNQKEWNTIGEVKGMGNSSMINKYSFRDEKGANGEVYYRVKQTDFNGEYSYSDMMSIKGNTESTEPTVSYNEDKLGYVVHANGLKSIQVINMNGETKYAASGNEAGNAIPTLAAGIYLVQIQTATNTYYQKVLMF